MSVDGSAISNKNAYAWGVSKVMSSGSELEERMDRSVQSSSNSYDKKSLAVRAAWIILTVELGVS